MIAVSVTLVLEGANDASAEDACGKPGREACPLQAFMRTEIAAPLASDDADALAKGLAKAARYAPDTAWTSWATFASDGAAAARKSDLRAVRAACRGCHDAWREAYRAKHRTRPLPHR